MMNWIPWVYARHSWWAETLVDQALWQGSRQSTCSQEREVLYVDTAPEHSNSQHTYMQAYNSYELPCYFKCYVQKISHIFFIKYLNTGMNGCILIQNPTNLDRSRFVRRDRSTPVKKRADLSGCSGRGHLVLGCTECRRPRPVLQVNKLCRRPAAQMGVTKLDFSQMRRSRSDLIENAKRFARLI